MKQLFLLLAFFSSMNLASADDLAATVTNSVIGLDNGAIELSVSGGVAPFSFSWVGPNGFISSDEDIAGLAPGEYCVTVTDQFCGVAALCVIVIEEVASVIQPEQNISFAEVFPNPFFTDFSIEMHLFKGGDYHFYLTDAGGKIVFTENRKLASGENIIHFALDEVLAGGNYEMTIRDEEAILLSRSVVHIR